MLVAQQEAQVNLDQAQIDNAKAILDYTNVIAPITGRTGIRLVDQGNIVHASDSTGIVVITQLQPISILFTLPQQQLGDVNRAFAGGALQVDVFGPDNKTVIEQGELKVVDNQVDPSTGTIKLKAEFANRELQLWPGAFVNVRLLINTLKQVVVAPTAAVQRGPSGTFVYVVQQDNKVAVRPVTVSQQDEVQAVLTKGLEANERVVTTGFARLTAGAQVAVTNAEAAPSPDAQPAQPRRERRRGGAQGQQRSEGQLKREPEHAAMSVSTPFIRRPVATSLLAFAVMLGGWLGYWWLPVSSLPQVDFPTIQVTTQLPGASPDTIASLVTAPLERQFGQIPSLSIMTSSSSFGISQITLQFDLGRDIDGAAQDVQAAINAAGSTLPRGLPYPPTYSKVNPADAPVSRWRSPRRRSRCASLSDLADTLMAQRLAKSAASAASRSRAASGPRCAFRPICPGSPPTASASRIFAQAIVGANVSGAKGSLDGAHQSYTISRQRPD